MTIEILDTAGEDLKRGYRFYEKQAAGLGEYFLDSIYSDIDSLLIYHGIHPMKFGSYHCLFSKRFPFAIYYTISEERILVDAVLDCRQDPQRAGKRFSNP
jgi:plasmid stabilization system protein ParE